MLMKLRWYFLVYLLSTIRTCTSQVSFNVTESLETNTAASNTTDIPLETSTEESLKSADNSSTPSSADEKLLEMEIAAFNKHRRNGMGVGGDYSSRWENDRKKFQFDFPLDQQRGGYHEDEFLPHSQHPTAQNYKDRQRFNEKVYPVRVQGCSQFSRDVSRDSSSSSMRSGTGILQSWLGAAVFSPGSGKSSGEDKRTDGGGTPYVTTATAKIPSTYRTQENKRFEYESASGSQSKAGSDAYRARGSASKNFYNYQSGGGGGGSQSDDDRERDVQPWRSNKNNRVVYYEYNLDDSSKRSEFQPPYYQQTNPDRNYPSAGFDPQCELEEQQHSRKSHHPAFSKHHHQYDSRQRYSNVFPSQHKLSNNFNQDLDERRFPPQPPPQSYYLDESYQNRNLERSDNRNAMYDYSSMPFQSQTPPTRLSIPTMGSPFGQELTSSDAYEKHDAPRQIPYDGGATHRFTY